VAIGDQRLRIEREQGAEAADGQRDAERERELLAAEPAREDRALRDDERLAAHAERGGPT
jgi:hypothetical protein